MKRIWRALTLFLVSIGIIAGTLLLAQKVVWMLTPAKAIAPIPFFRPLPRRPMPVMVFDSLVSRQELFGRKGKIKRAGCALRRVVEHKDFCTNEGA